MVQIRFVRTICRIFVSTLKDKEMTSKENLEIYNKEIDKLNKEYKRESILYTIGSISFIVVSILIFTI